MRNLGWVAIAIAGCTSGTASTVTFHARAKGPFSGAQLVVSTPAGTIRSDLTGVAVPSDTVVDVEAGDAVTFVGGFTRKWLFTVAAVEPGDDITYVQPEEIDTSGDIISGPPQAPSPSQCVNDAWAMSWQADPSSAATGFYFVMSFGIEAGSNTWEGVAPPDGRSLVLPDGLVQWSTRSLVSLDGYSNTGYATYADWRSDPGLWAARTGEQVTIDHCGLLDMKPDVH